MNIDEAKERVAAQNEKLRALEAEVARLASTHATPVLLAILRALVEMVCGAQGSHFAVLNKTKLYEGVLLMLRDKGIS
jgi:DNA-binding FadR family transcriptional regulator